jgi:ParB family transcriptional regulator, chromosome partitioning protein
MTKRKNVLAAAPASGTTLFIPLNKLKKSPRNARKTPHSKAEIAALVASIAANGMLQNPVVEPELTDSGKPTGFYLVTIGEGRRQAQLLRAKKKEITKAEPIRCLIETAHNALEISLAENAIRAPMHPADQFEAFFELNRDHGMNAEDIAARFGVTAAVVRQRLKLAAISPVLMQAYRDEELNLDQLTAFAFTDDHAKQERVWADLGAHMERDEILEILNGDHIAVDDSRAQFVGIDAYQAAGGAILRDLFDEEHQGFCTDPELLNRLVREKLEGVSACVQAEGWKWVEIMPHYDYQAVADMRRIYPEAPPLSEDAQAKIEALEAEYGELDGDDASDDVIAEAERIDQAIAELRGDDVFDPAEVACAGAIISIGRDGEPRIERGFIRPEDDTGRKPKGKSKPRLEGPVPLSEKLVAELTAYRTVALRNALGRDPDTALMAVVHALACVAFFPHSEVKSCLKIRSQSEYLERYAPGIEESDAAKEIAKRHGAWIDRIPDDAEELWTFILTLDQRDLLALLADCASVTVNAVAARDSRDMAADHADQLAQVVLLDMRPQWRPTVQNYLGRVSKDRILEAVREGVSKEAADNLASMKKLAMAEAAEHRLQGRDWLPPVLRAPQPVPLAAE